jgi:hypothetical protein
MSVTTISLAESDNRETELLHQHEMRFGTDPFWSLPALPDVNGKIPPPPSFPARHSFHAQRFLSAGGLRSLAHPDLG